MNIRQKLKASLIATVLSLSLGFMVLAWGGLRYESLRKYESIVQGQVTHWLSLQFQVSQYMKHSLEVAITGRTPQTEEVSQRVSEIIHTFIQLEKLARAKGELRKFASNADERDQLVAIRAQFGLINEELEISLALFKRDPRAGTEKLRMSSLRTKLENEFITQIAAALREGENEKAAIETELANVKKQSALLFVAVTFLSLLFSILASLKINRSINHSIALAQRELVRGSAALGAGNLDANVQLEAQDELAVVGDAFNQMARDLRAAQSMIEEQRMQITASSKMSALGEMAGGVAHEINNPLAIIRTYSSQIQDLLEDEILDKSMLRDISQKIETTTVRIAKIVQALRSFSRDGRQDPVETVRIKTLFEETFHLCAERFRALGIELEVGAYPVDLSLWGRPTEVSQVLINLLNNAHDAISTLSTKWLKVGVTATTEQIAITITDSGPGIPTEIQQKIFQPFFTTKKLGEGTGLGLSISIGLVKGLKGSLKIDNSCANTCFVLTLPRAQSQTALAATPKAA